MSSQRGLRPRAYLVGMRSSFASRVVYGALVVLLAASIFPARAAEVAAGSLTGDWSGTSVCAANHDSCKDEKALYHLTGPDERKLVTVVGSKIVDGREIVMGPPMDFRYDTEKKTLLLENQVGVFRFTVGGEKNDKLDGTLTLPSGVLYRRIALKKVAKES